MGEQSLIERLKAASVGSRELDAEIMARFFVQDERFIGCTCDCCPGGRHPDLVWIDPDTDKWVTTARSGHAFTTSLDAIVGLIERKLPGCGWAVGKRPSGGGWARAFRPTGPGPEVYIESNTPALALCIALLSALDGQEGSEAGDELAREGSVSGMNPENSQQGGAEQ